MFSFPALFITVHAGNLATTNVAAGVGLRFADSGHPGVGRTSGGRRGLVDWPKILMGNRRFLTTVEAMLNTGASA